MFIKVIEKGCPICEGEVAGNSKKQYFCKNCNMLFRSPQLNQEGKISKVMTDNKIVLDRIEGKKKD